MLPLDIFDFIIMDIEGGSRMTDDPRDAGGQTRYGISKKFHPDVDVANLDKSRAWEWYDRNLWQKVRGNDLPKAVGLCLFDTMVNPCKVPAVKLLQGALGVEKDNVFGNQTLAAVKAADQRKLVEAILTSRLRNYLSKNDAAEETYELGWATRVLRVGLKACEYL